uniref:Uncharacterized protein n=1 Tax=Percolomonas cosmopolitus TaxID=63605 RepID=A0A7S1KM73_9EUKA
MEPPPPQSSSTNETSSELDSNFFLSYQESYNSVFSDFDALQRVLEGDEQYNQSETETGSENAYTGVMEELHWDEETETLLSGRDEDVAAGDRVSDTSDVASDSSRDRGGGMSSRIDDHEHQERRSLLAEPHTLVRSRPSPARSPRVDTTILDPKSRLLCKQILLSAKLMPKFTPFSFRTVTNDLVLVSHDALHQFGWRRHRGDGRILLNRLTKETTVQESATDGMEPVFVGISHLPLRRQNDIPSSSLPCQLYSISHNSLTGDLFLHGGVDKDATKCHSTLYRLKKNTISGAVSKLTHIPWEPVASRNSGPRVCEHQCIILARLGLYITFGGWDFNKEKRITDLWVIEYERERMWRRVEKRDYLNSALDENFSTMQSEEPTLSPDDSSEFTMKEEPSIAFPPAEPAIRGRLESPLPSLSLRSQRPNLTRSNTIQEIDENLLNSDLPAPRSHHAMTAVDWNCIIVDGGSNDCEFFADTWMLRLSHPWISENSVDYAKPVSVHDLKFRWELLACTGDVPPKRCHHSIRAYGGDVFILYGDKEPNHLNAGLCDLVSLYRLNLQTLVWSRYSIHGNVPRFPCHSMRFEMSHYGILVYGGYDEENDEHSKNLYQIDFHDSELHYEELKRKEWDVLERLDMERDQTRVVSMERDVLQMEVDRLLRAFQKLRQEGRGSD